MQRKEALLKLRKILGKGAAWEIKADAPTADERAEALARHAELVAKRKAISEAKEKRHQELLKDPEFQRLREEYQAANKIVAANNSIIYSYKFTVGKVDNVGGLGFFHVDAQGDSWEEIFAKLKEREKKLAP